MGARASPLALFELRRLAPPLAGGCPAALASLFADARGRAQEVVATL